jgi:hypothetical protein
MSRENVELVKALYPEPDTDIIPLFRDDVTFARMISPFLTDDFESVMVWPGQTRTPPRGLSQLRGRISRRWSI